MPMCSLINNLVDIVLSFPVLCHDWTRPFQCMQGKKFVIIVETWVKEGGVEGLMYLAEVQETQGVGGCLWECCGDFKWSVKSGHKFCDTSILLLHVVSLLVCCCKQYSISYFEHRVWRLVLIGMVHLADFCGGEGVSSLKEVGGKLCHHSVCSIFYIKSWAGRCRGCVSIWIRCHGVDERGNEVWGMPRFE